MTTKQLEGKLTRKPLPTTLLEDLKVIFTKGMANLVTEFYRYGLSAHKVTPIFDLSIPYQGDVYEGRLQLPEVEVETKINKRGDVVIVKRMKYFYDKDGKVPVPEEDLKNNGFHGQFWFNNIFQEYVEKVQAHLPGVDPDDLAPGLSFDYCVQYTITHDDDEYFAFTCPCGGIHIKKNGELYRDIPSFKVSSDKGALTKACAELISEIYYARTTADGVITIDMQGYEALLEYKLAAFTETTLSEEAFTEKILSLLRLKEDEWLDSFDNTGTNIEFVQLARTKHTPLTIERCLTEEAHMKRLDKAREELEEYEGVWINRLLAQIRRSEFSTMYNEINKDKACIEGPEISKETLDKLEELMKEHDFDEESTVVFGALPLRWTYIPTDENCAKIPKPHQLHTDLKVQEGMHRLDISGREHVFDLIVEQVVTAPELEKYRQILIEHEVISEEQQVEMFFGVAVQTRENNS